MYVSIGSNGGKCRGNGSKRPLTIDAGKDLVGIKISRIGGWDPG
jgi:hypothetical protein